MESEFIENQEQLRPQDEKNEVYLYWNTIMRVVV